MNLTCVKCNKMFTSQKRYDNHIQIDCQKQHACTDCNITLSSKRNLDDHIKSYHTHSSPSTQSTGTSTHSSGASTHSSGASTHSNGASTHSNGASSSQLNISGHVTIGNNSIISNGNSNVIIVNNYDMDIKCVPPKFLEMNDYDIISRLYPSLYKDAIQRNPANPIMYIINRTLANPNNPIYNSTWISNLTDSNIHTSNGSLYVINQKYGIIYQIIITIKDNIKFYLHKYKHVFTPFKISCINKFINEIGLYPDIKSSKYVLKKKIHPDDPNIYIEEEYTEKYPLGEDAYTFDNLYIDISNALYNMKDKINKPLWKTKLNQQLRGELNITDIIIDTNSNTYNLLHNIRQISVSDDEEH